MATFKVFEKKERVPLNYKEKYEDLSEQLRSVHQFFEASYKTSPKTLLIDTQELDSKLSDGTINYKQAYFNLLNFCHEKAKKGSLCVVLKQDQVEMFKFAAIKNKRIATDLMLMKELPKLLTKDTIEHSILTPEGLYQGFYINDGSEFKKQKFIIRQVLNKEELKHIGLDEYFNKPELFGTSIKAELLQNGLLYDMDATVAKKHSFYLKEGLVKCHTASFFSTSGAALTKLNAKVGPLDLQGLLEQLIQFPNSSLHIPAAKNMDGCIQHIVSFKEDFYNHLEFKDRYLVELLSTVENVLDKEDIESFKKKIKEETHFENDVKDLIWEIIFEVYKHAQTHPNDKARCYELVDNYLTFHKETRGEYRIYNDAFMNRKIIVTEDQYISYAMEQLITNKAHNTTHRSFYQNMTYLFNPPSPILDDFKYNAEKNARFIAKTNPQFRIMSFDDGNKERTYYPSNFSNPIHEHTELLEKKPIIVKALHEKFQDPATNKEQKLQIERFLSNLVEFQAKAIKLQIQAELFKDPFIANPIKAAYCNKLKKDAARIEKAMTEQHDQLKVQIEEIFTEEIKRDKNYKTVGIVLGVIAVVLAAALIAVAILVNPLAGIGLIGAGLFALGFFGFYEKGANSIGTKGAQLIEGFQKHGGEARQFIETQNDINEKDIEEFDQVNPEKNTPEVKF